MSDKLAIDFGTTNSIVARWHTASGQVEMVAIPGLSRAMQDGAPL